MKKKFPKKRTLPFDYLYGTHACEAALRNPKRQCYELFLLKEEAAGTLIEQVKEEGVPCRYLEEEELLSYVPKGAVHQGCVLKTSVFEFENFDAFLKRFPETGGLVLALDQLTDPQNLGAIIRSAAAFSVAGIVMTKHQSCPITPLVAKAASGGLEKVPLFQVSNLAQTLEKMKKAGFWCYGLAEGGQTLRDLSFPEKTLLIVGAEGKGIRPLTRERCDEVISIPTVEGFTTLNASNAAAVSLYAWFTQCGR